jgi:RecA-family ATPase
MQDFAQRFPRVRHDPHAVPPPVPWLVDGLWLRGKINALLGPEKAGKSRLIGHVLTHMLAHPAGGPVLWRADRGGPCCWHHGFTRVLYLNAEEREEDVQARVNETARHNGIEPRADWPIDYVNAAGMQLHRAEERAAFERTWLVKREYDLIVLDPLRRVHGGDENNNSAMAPFHNDLRRWSNLYNVALLIVHHTPKLREDDDMNRIATWSRGATDLPSLLDGATMLRHAGSAADHQVRMLKRLGRFPPLDDVQLLDYGAVGGFVAQVNKFS